MMKPTLSAVAVFCCAAAWPASRPLAMRSTVARDDYENESLAREGSLQIVTGIVSPGLLTQTRKGLYKSRGDRQIRCAHFGMVSGAGLFAESSLRLYALSDGACLEGAFVVGKLPGDHAFTARMTRCGGELSVAVLEDGVKVGDASVGCGSLPADFSVAVSPSGEFRVSVRSLADSGVSEAVGKAQFLAGYPKSFRAFWWLRSPKGGEAEATVDECRIGISEADDSPAAVPLSIERLPEFDPEKAGWRKVFEDEFDGTEVDWKEKWFQPYDDVHPRELAETDGKGHLKIRIETVPGTTNRLRSTSLYSRQAFGYGYYEARLKFTSQNGFWSAFWTYGDSNTNPFLDGFEIDGYEYYYTRIKNTADARFNCLDHNLHVRGGLGRSKSWNYKSELPGPIDRWYTLGVRWTPFEITYYLEGKAIRSKSAVGHSPWETVTFDAANHAACTSPTHAVLSGCIMGGSWNKEWQDLSGCRFPAYFTVDWVRVWEYPDPPDERPSVEWSAETLAGDAFVATGAAFRVAVHVRPAAKTGAKLTGVYLFSNGFLLQHKTEPPYAFEIPLTDEFMSRTAYSRPGRQGVVFNVDGMPHELHVFAQDSNGRVGRTARTLPRIPLAARSRPYMGEAQRLPGPLNPAKFDDGGPEVGYHKNMFAMKGARLDLNPRPSRKFRGGEGVSCAETGDALDFAVSGDWLNYTADIAAAGAYDLKIPYGANGTGLNELRFLVDGRPAGSVRLSRHESVRFERDLEARTRLELPAGRHVLTLLPIGPMGIGTIGVSPAKSAEGKGDGK